MSKNNQQETLADKICGILNTAPVEFDPEDDDVDETRAQTVNNLQNTLEADDPLVTPSIKKNLAFLDEEDERYAGKKLTRKDLDSSSDKFSSEENDQSISDNESVENEDEEEEDGNESQEGSEDEEDDSQSGSSYESGIEDVSDHDDPNFKHMNETSVSKETSRGMCVKNQISIWESLLEIRIQLQKCLVASNKMPQFDTYKAILEASDDDYRKKSVEVTENVSKLLDSFLTLQSLCLKQYPKTKKLLREKDGKHEKETVTEESDEEIPSDTDEEIKSDSEPEELEDKTSKSNSNSRKRKISDYEKDISEIHSKYAKYRNSVIQKWHEKTKILLSKNKDSTSVLDQIQYMLSDKEKLLKSTRTKRSSYKIIGKENEECNSENDQSDTNNDQNEFYDPEIFDDDDFYHQLLRELIEFRSADLTDPVQLGRQWVQLQSLRNKMKRNIDTRATKGRKIRYAVHSKLVNFMAPFDENKMSDFAKNDLYNSLFGEHQSVVKTNG